MKKNEENVPLEIFSGINWEAEMVKNLLENSGIDAFLEDEIMGTLAPWYLTQGQGSVKVIVSKSDYDKAKLIVTEYEKNKLNN